MADRRQPGFSLALGSGGARGFAHIGVLAALAEAGLRPRAIAGTSVGAFVGAMYASGADPEQMAKGVESLELREVAGLTSFTLKPGSVMSAARIEAQMRTVLPGTFADLEVPFACVATDLVTGDAVVVTEGDLPRAVRASMTIPILFDPVHDETRLLVDGGVVDPVPVAVARDLGGGPVVAVDVGTLTAIEMGEHTRRGFVPLMESGDSPSIVQVGTRTLDVMSHRLSILSLGDADVIIAPDVGGFFFADVLEGSAIIAEGARAGKASVPDVRAAIAEASLTSLSRWWRRVTAG